MELKLICDTIWFNKYEWEDNMESFYDWFDELSQCEIIFSNAFMKKLINYLQKNNKFVWWPCDDMEINIKAMIDYDDPITFINNIII